MKKILLSFLLLFSLFLNAQIRIKMSKVGGVYTTPCQVNGLKLRFIFDTGASNVSISLAEAVFMLKNGYLAEDDLHGSSYSQIANGEVVKNTTVNLKELEIGGIKLHNIEAIIIHELSAPLLLGQSAIQKLGRIQIENDILTILDRESQISSNFCNQAKDLLVQAEKQYFDRLYTLSSENYQKVYDLCPNSMDCFSIYLLGLSYYFSEKHSLAINYLEKVPKCGGDSLMLAFSYGTIGDSYSELKDYDNSILSYEKALNYSVRKEDISHFNFSIGFLLKSQNKYSQSNEYFFKSIQSYLEILQTSVNEVMKGKVKDSVLGERYWNISRNFALLDQIEKSQNFLIKSALCGYEPAIDACKKFEIKYELYRE